MSRHQIVSELHQQTRKNFPRRRVVLKGIDDLWQVDLVEMIVFAKENQNYRYILMVIDCFSKYAWAVPLQNKTSSLVTQSMLQVFNSSKRSPMNLQTDMGTEFWNKQFKQLMNIKKINHYATYSYLKASIVERLNKTIKNKMWKMFSFRASYKWIDKLEGIMQEYNNTKHRTIKMAPVDVNSKQIEEQLLNTVFNFKPTLVKNKYNIGDHVRISKFKGVFAKGYTVNWSPELFTVKAVSNKFPVTYKLEDYEGQPIAGRFYESELQKTKNPTAYLVENVVKRKANKLLVKWFGFDDTHNSWINKSNLI